MQRTRWTAIAAGSVLLVGCTGDAEPDAAPDAPVATETVTAEPTATPEEQSPAPSPDDDTGEQAADGQVLGFDATEATPGTWAVGEAGTVSFEVSDGALVLGEVSPNDGWRVTDVDEAPDDIEVEFERDDTEVEIDIELSSTGVLQVEIDTDIDPAEPSTLTIGDAGEITWSRTGNTLQLADLTVGNDWQVTQRDEEPDEIEVELRRGAADWDIEIELDDGQVEVELDFEVSSQL